MNSSFSRRLLNKMGLVNTSMRKFPTNSIGRNEANDLIRGTLLKDEPCMISRWGSTELNSYLAGRISLRSNLYRQVSFHLGITPDWLTIEPDQTLFHELHVSSGVFPPTRQQFDEFCDIYQECHQEIDILGSWLRAEKLLSPRSKPIQISLRDLSPFVHLSNRPWTELLKGKKVLIIHPFATSISAQLPKRRLIFGDYADRILPEAEYSIITPPQGYGGTTVEGFDSWTKALLKLKEEVSRTEFDVALLGCGAYGMPLAHFIKTRLEKKSIHVGGILQLQFGIIGTRWHDDETVNSLFNSHWIKPLATDRPDNFRKGERGQTPYW